MWKWTSCCTAAGMARRRARLTEAAIREVMLSPCARWTCGRRMLPHKLDLNASCIPAVALVYRPVSAYLQSPADGPPRSAAGRAYHYVNERLLDGRYPGGVLLSENE